MENIDDIKYWVSFSRIPGIGRIKTSQLLDYFTSMENAWKAPVNELKKAGLDSRSAEAIGNLRSRIYPDKEFENLCRYKVEVVTYKSTNYPTRLKEIDDYPPILYVRGNIFPSDDCCLAVVGARRPTMYGRQVTEEIVTYLARNGITIVSGLARGIDSVAHKTALGVEGRTIAVFGCGLDIVYPAENAGIAREIMERGALLSEYPLGVRPKADNFPRRNRIMSGLSLGVLVVEAGETSGALITTNQALEQNRDVFAIPGSIFSPMSKGTNRLIQEGAKLVHSYVDILEELNLTIIAKQMDLEDFTPSNDAEALLLKQLGNDPVHIDEVCRRAGLETHIVSSTLSLMELKGIVKQVGSMHYVLKYAK
jgi:DNA processing protein